MDINTNQVGVQAYKALIDESKTMSKKLALVSKIQKTCSTKFKDGTKLGGAHVTDVADDRSYVTYSYLISLMESPGSLKLALIVGYDGLWSGNSKVACPKDWTRARMLVL